VGQVDALKMVEHVRTRLVDMATSENFLRDENLSAACRGIWNKGGIDGGLVSELWIEGTFPGELSKDTLHSLAKEGEFPKDLCDHLDGRGVFPKDRHLYNHQSEVLRASTSNKQPKPTFIITAPTGLGKTEAFLLPMLNDLWKAPPRQKNGGMRCLILYPMNALVADQIDRIYRWLQGQNRLSVFHFTGETPENSRWANKVGEPKWESCRMRTRQEARGLETHDGESINQEPFGSVPDIVITNYSMLEYMLCRPQDHRFFGPDLRCIILDEAHLYTGALATEIMMLLRRVRERCGVKANDVLQMATSATLGGDEQILGEFGSALFSTKIEMTHVIRGRSAKHNLGNIESPPIATSLASDLAKYVTFDFDTLTVDDELVDDRDLVNQLGEKISCLVSNEALERAKETFPATPARFLHMTLREAPLIRKIAEILSEENGNVISLDKMAERIFPEAQKHESRNATILLLRLAAAARLQAKELPLVPHRLHFLVRAPEGLSLCLNPNCSGPGELRIEGVGCLQETGEQHCRYCGHILLPVHRCDNCGEWALAIHINQEASTVEPGYYAISAHDRTFYLLARPHNLELEEMVVDSQNGTIRGHGAKGVSLWKAPMESDDDHIQQCPTCQSQWSISVDEEQEYELKQKCHPLYGGRPFALSVIAETILNDLPSFRGVSRNWKPAEGRRLLSFSDSRSSAARLGPLLTRQHEMQVLRAAIARSVSELPSNEIQEQEYLKNEIRKTKDMLRNTKLSPSLRHRLENELNTYQKELLQIQSGTPFHVFAKRVADREEIAQILDRDTADQQRAEEYGQNNWKRNFEAVQEHIEGLIALELARPMRKRTSVESAGLIEIVYPGVDKLEIPPLLEERLPSAKIQEKLNSVWPDFIALLLDTVRGDGCITWSSETPSRLWLGESPLYGRWLTRTQNGWGARAFVGQGDRQLRRRFTKNMLCAAGCSEEQAATLSENVLQWAFNQLYERANMDFNWLKREEHHQTSHEEEDIAIQILMDRLSIRTPTHFFRCEATGTIWTHSALGWAPIEGCIGTLREVNQKDINEDPRWGRARRDYLESLIFKKGLWAEEHSAQLAPQENRRLQNLFKEGIRNILSCTTTMELGIDIGGLNGVLLSNVPPGPANHRQRAGRAGRRSDGSAVVVTFARGSNYEREVFKRFGDFLKKELRNPMVFLDRERIIQRHLNAVLLSEFIRGRQPEKTGAMQAFGKMGSFCGIVPPLRWHSASSGKPIWDPQIMGDANLFLVFLESLRIAKGGLRRRFSELATRTETDLNNLHQEDVWQAFIDTAVKCYRNTIGEWNEEIQQLRDTWNEIPVNPKREDRDREMAKANSIRYQIYTLSEITVIEWLADHRFLPRYGFPINLQQLIVRKACDDDRRDYSEPDERYKLERSSLLALSEYVPESRVLVGGRVVISRGLRKHWTDSNLDRALGLQYFSLECQEEHVYIRQDQNEVCPICGGNPIKKQQLVFPRFGYTTAGWEPVRREINPERIGEQTVCPIGFAENSADEPIEAFGGINGLRVTYKEEAELLVRNAGSNNCGFAICTRCGFAMSEDDYGQGRMSLPRDFISHASVFSTNARKFCWEKGEKTAPVLRNRVLAAREFTDMLRIEWPGATIYDFDGVYSLGRAMIQAGTRLLELDERELGVETMPLKNPNLGIVIFETSPGGAGHCVELSRLGSEWIKMTRQVLYVNDEHHARCKRACLDCILDFSGQYRASQLNRIAALQLIENALQRT